MLFFCSAKAVAAFYEGADSSLLVNMELIASPPSSTELTVSPPDRQSWQSVRLIWVANPPEMGELIASPPDIGELIASPPDIGELIASPPDIGELIASPPDMRELIASSSVADG